MARECCPEVEGAQPQHGIWYPPPAGARKYEVKKYETTYPFGASFGNFGEIVPLFVDPFSEPFTYLGTQGQAGMSLLCRGAHPGGTKTAWFEGGGAQISERFHNPSLAPVALV